MQANMQARTVPSPS